jgi:hypothetical protein
MCLVRFLISNHILHKTWRAQQSVFVKDYNIARQDPLFEQDVLNRTHILSCYWFDCGLPVQTNKSTIRPPSKMWTCIATKTAKGTWVIHWGPCRSNLLLLNIHYHHIRCEEGLRHWASMLQTAPHHLQSHEMQVECFTTSQSMPPWNMNKINKVKDHSDVLMVLDKLAQSQIADIEYKPSLDRWYQQPSNPHILLWQHCNQSWNCHLKAPGIHQ